MKLRALNHYLYYKKNIGVFMETILIEITNQKAVKLLYELEQLNLIKVLSKDTRNGQKLSEKYAGKLPAEIADELQSHVTESRNECRLPFQTPLLP
jgi:hypothetical protein